MKKEIEFNELKKLISENRSLLENDFRNIENLLNKYNFSIKKSLKNNLEIIVTITLDDNE